MKKLLSMMLIMASFVCFTACSDDEEEGFNYPMETLYGTWEGTDVYANGKWYDITSWVFSDMQFSITFYSDGTYYGRGYFGNGSGTYSASGNTIRTYVNGKPYYQYEVKSLTNDKAHLSMGVEGSSEKLEIKVRKK
jgi:hypothetical protein